MKCVSLLRAASFDVFRIVFVSSFSQEQKKWRWSVMILWPHEIEGNEMNDDMWLREWLYLAFSVVIHIHKCVTSGQLCLLTRHFVNALTPHNLWIQRKLRNRFLFLLHHTISIFSKKNWDFQEDAAKCSSSCTYGSQGCSGGWEVQKLTNTYVSFFFWNFNFFFRIVKRNRFRKKKRRFLRYERDDHVKTKLDY